MEHLTLGQEFLAELEAEAAATRKCLERAPENLFDYKPHEKSMAMGYLVQLVAEIPKWISYMIEEGDIDFTTFKHKETKTTAAVVAYFDANMESVRRALGSVSDEAMMETFNLKNNGQILMSSSRKDMAGSSINHLVHHRGQLTVYLRLNNLPVPSIYGPSADEPGF